MKKLNTLKKIAFTAKMFQIKPAFFNRIGEYIEQVKTEAGLSPMRIKCILNLKKLMYVIDY